MTDPAKLWERIEELEKRLAAAEQVCVIFGWTAAAGDSDRDKAVAQAWQDWANAYGCFSPTAEWNERIAVLARRRDDIRERTLAKYLCDEHKMFRHQLDQFLGENYELLGRLAASERADLAVSLEQMRHGEGRVVSPEELREGNDD